MAIQQQPGRCSLEQKKRPASPNTNADSLSFGTLGRREVVGQFDGGTITSDGGALLLRELEEKTGFLTSFAECFVDHRDPRYTQFSLEELLGQRVFGLVLGYEDLNDHEELRKDPLLATLTGRADPTGQDRPREQDRGKPLAGKSTLNRLELTPKGGPTRYKKIEYCEEQLEEFFLALFLRCQGAAPERVVIDLDATNDPLYGEQEGRFFQGYYNQYCYLPLYAFCDDFLLCAKLRTAEKEAAEGSLPMAQWLTARIQEQWPQTEILFRGDSGFARDNFMDWCETHPSGKVHYLFGLAKNPRLLKEIETELEIAEQEYPAYQQHLAQLREQLTDAGVTKGEIEQRLAKLDNPCRRYSEFRYSTLDSWTRDRRVIAKAEYLGDKANPRFIVTSLPLKEGSPRTLYEELYCARGDMENRIKENQLCLFADRTSTQLLRSNQLRLWFSSVAYMLFVLIRRYGLRGTQHQRAQCDTIRNKLLKIGAQVVVSVRRVSVRLASSYPFKDLFVTVFRNLQRMPDYVTC